MDAKKKYPLTPPMLAYLNEIEARWQAYKEEKENESKSK